MASVGTRATNQGLNTNAASSGNSASTGPGSGLGTNDTSTTNTGPGTNAQSATSGGARRSSRSKNATSVTTTRSRSNSASSNSRKRKTSQAPHSQSLQTQTLGLNGRVAQPSPLESLFTARATPGHHKTLNPTLGAHSLRTTGGASGRYVGSTTPGYHQHPGYNGTSQFLAPHGPNQALDYSPFAAGPSPQTFAQAH